MFYFLAYSVSLSGTDNPYRTTPIHNAVRLLYTVSVNQGGFALVSTDLVSVTWAPFVLFVSMNYQRKRHRIILSELSCVSLLNRSSPALFMSNDRSWPPYE